MKQLLSKVVGPVNSLLAHIPEWVVNLAMRLVVFKIFWFSVQTKISGVTIAGQHFAFWSVTDNTFLLFDFEYGIPLIPTTLAAYLGTFGEFFFSLMILLGFMTRFAALGLMGMTLVIQFFVYPEAWWSVHVFWFVMLLYLIRNGGGKASIDHFIFNK